MYQPPFFREDRLEVQHALIRAHPLGTLVTSGADGLTANPIPFRFYPGESPLGTLRAHLARANPQWRTFGPDQEALVIFQGVDGYISPSWYATKQETGKVVPTWNYATVHAHGRVEVIDDPAWLMRQIGDLTGDRERALPQPWSVSDAPETFIASQLKGIIGIEIAIARIEGKWKASQNRHATDRAGVVEGLRASNPAMAALVEESGRGS